MKFETRHFYGTESLSNIIQLRYEVLRQPLGLSLEQSRFPGDELPTTVHIVGFLEDSMVSCLTILPSNESIRSNDSNTGQLRGMAVANAQRRFGFGAKLLESAHDWARTKGISLWCNARSEAVGFYLKHGWQATGTEFEVANVGPHIPMIWSPNDVEPLVETDE